MPLVTKSLPDLIALCLGFFRAQFPGKDSSDASYFGQVSKALAMILLEGQNALLQVDQDWPPSGAQYTPGRQSSSAALDQAAVLLGLPNGAGGYGRRLASISSGGAGTLFAPAGTVYADGLVLSDPTGQVQVQLSGSVTIPALASSAPGAFISITTGIAANLPLGTTLTFQSPPPGAQPTVDLDISPLTGAEDQELDAALLARIYDRLQNPRTGGRSSDWKQWLSSVQAIKQIYVYPKRSGTGSVDVVIMVGGTGEARTPSLPIQAQAVAAINVYRPVCSQANVLLPYFPSGRNLTIRSLAYPSLDKYAWDWVSGAGNLGYAVTAFTPGSPAVLQIAGDITVLSPTLAAKITLNAKPRMLVCSTAGPPVPLQVPIIGYQVVAGPFTNFELDTLPDGWVDPVVNDRVAPGGPLAVNQLDATVGPIHKSAAQRVLEYVDSLGPSRQSGYADDQYYWDDTVRIDDIKATLIGTLDLDGTPMVKTTGNSPLSDTLIQVGSGIPAALDFRTLDATPGQSPEVAQTKMIIVTGP